MEKTLNENDIKLLKSEKRIGYSFLLLIYALAGLSNLAYYLINKENINFSLLLFGNLGVIMLGLFVCTKVNKDVNLALRLNRKTFIVREVIEKYERIDFHSTGRFKMKEVTKYYIHTGNFTHEVDKIVYDKLIPGDLIHIYYGKNTGIVLSYEKVEGLS